MTFSVAEFDAAIAQWDRETCFHSFPHTILRGPGYEKVKSFGKDAIPYLLKKLQEAKEDESRPIPSWGIFWLLDALTGADIFVGEQEGGFKKGDYRGTLDAWLAWGRANGHIKG